MYSDNSVDYGLPLSPEELLKEYMAFLGDLHAYDDNLRDYLGKVVESKFDYVGGDIGLPDSNSFSRVFTSIFEEDKEFAGSVVYGIRTILGGSKFRKVQGSFFDELCSVDTKDSAALRLLIDKNTPIILNTLTEIGKENTKLQSFVLNAAQKQIIQIGELFPKEKRPRLIVSHKGEDAKLMISVEWLDLDHSYIEQNFVPDNVVETYKKIEEMLKPAVYLLEKEPCNLAKKIEKIWGKALDKKPVDPEIQMLLDIAGDLKESGEHFKKLAASDPKTYVEKQKEKQSFWSKIGF